MAMNEKAMDQASEFMQRDMTAIEHHAQRILECEEQPRLPDQAENLGRQASELTPHDELVQGAARAIVDRELTKLARIILQSITHDRRTVLPQEIKDYIKRITNVEL